MYNYQTEKPKIFLEANQKDFLKIRDWVKKQHYFEMGDAIDVVYSDSWLVMVYVDRLKELGEIQEVTKEYTCGQERLFRTL